MYNSDTRDTIAIVLVVLLIIIAILYGVIFYNSLKQQSRIEKDCGEEHTTFTSEVFKCPDGKPFVHFSSFDKTASAMCCAKE